MKRAKTFLFLFLHVIYPFLEKKSPPKLPWQNRACCSSSGRQCPCASRCKVREATERGLASPSPAAPRASVSASVKWGGAARRGGAAPGWTRGGGGQRRRCCRSVTGGPAAPAPCSPPTPGRRGPGVEGPSGAAGGGPGGGGGRRSGGRGGGGPRSSQAAARRRAAASELCIPPPPGSLHSLLYLRALSILSDVSRAAPNRRSSLVRTMEGPRPIGAAARLAAANGDGAVLRVMLPALRV